MKSARQQLLAQARSGATSQLAAGQQLMLAEGVLQSEMRQLAPGLWGEGTQHHDTSGISENGGGCARATAGVGFYNTSSVFGAPDDGMDIREDRGAMQGSVEDEIDVVGGEIDHEEMLRIYDELRSELLQQGEPCATKGVSQQRFGSYGTCFVSTCFVGTCATLRVLRTRHCVGRGGQGCGWQFCSARELTPAPVLPLIEHAILREYEELMEQQAEQAVAEVQTEVDYLIDIADRVICPVCQGCELQLVEHHLECMCGLRFPARGVAKTPHDLETFILQSLRDHRWAGHAKQRWCMPA